MGLRFGDFENGLVEPDSEVTKRFQSNTFRRHVYRLNLILVVAIEAHDDEILEEEEVHGSGAIPNA